MVNHKKISAYLSDVDAGLIVQWWNGDPIPHLIEEYEPVRDGILFAAGWEEQWARPVAPWKAK